MSEAVPHLQATDTTDTLAATLNEFGAVIVHDLMPGLDTYEGYIVNASVGEALPHLPMRQACEMVPCA